MHGSFCAAIRTVVVVSGRRKKDEKNQDKDRCRPIHVSSDTAAGVGRHRIEGIYVQSGPNRIRND